MRILSALTYYVPNISGLTEYARRVAEGLVALGHDVVVLSMQQRPDLPLEETLNGVHVRRARPVATLHKGMLSIEFLTWYRQLAREADVVHLHLPMLEAGLLPFLTPRNTPIVATYQCDVVPSRRRSLIDLAAVGAVRRSARRCLRAASQITVLSHDYAAGSSLVRGFEPKVVEIAPPDQASPGLAPKLRINSTEPRIGFLGRFVEEKGIGVLLDAFPAVRAAFPGARLVLGGNNREVAGGSLMHEVESRIDQSRDAVEVLGPIPADQLWDFYKSLDVFVLPSINSYEAFGMVQVEAMKAGVPVVATDLRGVRVPVRRTGNGAICEPGNPRSLAAAIIEVLRNPVGTPEQIAQRAWQHFSTEKCVRHFDALFKELCETR